jgi:N-acetylmuramoyl-L-alanine amidase
MKMLLLLFCLSVLSTQSFSQKDKIIVVIDPGHGGSDPGHLSSNKNHLPEKALNLLIAKKFGSYIEQNMKNVTIIYTRTDDSFPSLDDRVEKANNAKADYFISIHCNANARTAVHGTESHVHTMSSTKSVSLAKEFENEFSTRAGRHSRGVKDTDDREHSLQVLKFTNMTSVLVECGFLTNEKEASYLNTTNGQDIIASAIYRGFRTTIQKDFPAISFLKSGGSSNSIANSSGNSTPNTTKSTGKFTIQIMSSKEPMDTGGESFKKIGLSVTRKKLNTTSAYKYLYTVGTYDSQEAAKKDLEKVQKNGFKDAYIVKLE